MGDCVALPRDLRSEDDVLTGLRYGWNVVDVVEGEEALVEIELK